MIRNALILAIGSMFLFAIGCTEGPKSHEISPEQHQFVEAYCDLFRGCCERFGRSAGYDGCVGSKTVLLRGLPFDGTLAKDCLESTRAWTTTHGPAYCAAGREVLPRCSGVFPEVSESFEACEGRYESQPQCLPGSRGEGEDCTSDNCDTGLDCLLGRCERTLADGDACGSTLVPCRRLSSCFRGVCTPSALYQCSTD